MELFSCTFLLLTAGAALGLQYPLSYQYRYKASVSSVLPDVGTQQALASIDTTVTVDTVSSNSVLLQFRDTFVNEHHGQVECGGRHPDHSQRIHASVRDAFEVPFQVTYDFNKEPRLEVPPNEPLWMSNVRRGVVSLLLVVPTTEHLLKRSYTNTRTNTLDSDTSSSPIDPTSFTRMEDTIYGTCQVHYSLTSAPASAHAQHPLPLRDIQRLAGKSREGSWPQISEHLYALQRSPDLNHCHHRPLMFASTSTEGNNTHTASSDDRFFTQSSLGSLIVRGENDPRRSQNMRLEFAQVEAGAVMKPLGVHGGQIHVLTNQTLELEMTYKKRTAGLLEQLVPLQNLKFEVASPFSPPTTEPSSWVRYAANNDPLVPVYPEEYLLGYHANATSTQHLKEKLLQEASSAAAALQTLQAVHSSSGSKAHQDVPGGTPMASDVGERVLTIMEGIKALKKEDLADIYRLVGAKHGDLAKQVYHEAMAASGAPAAVAMVLDDLLGRRGHLLDSLVSLATIASAAQSPVSARQLMNFLQTLADRTSPAEGSDRVLMLSALLTTATTIRRLCAVDNRAFYGRQFDDNCGLEAELLHLIRHQMQATTASTEKVVFLRALGYLKTEAALQDLVKVVKANAADTRTRIAAVFSLTPSHTATSARGMVFESLDLVMTSQTEAPELRQAAVMVLLLWRPDQMWWLRLARSSWLEQSSSMSSFVSGVVRSVSALSSPAWQQQRQYATEAQALMRPVLSHSHQSFLSIIETFTHPPMLELETYMGWLLNINTLLPDDLFLSLHGKMNSIKVPLLEAELYADDIARLWRTLRGGRVLDSTSTSARLLKEFNDILHGLGARTSSRAPSGGLLLLRMFSGMHAALPCPASLLQLFRTPADAGDVHQSREAHFFKFMNPVWREVVVPTEVGVPVVGVIRTPTLVYQKGRYEVEYNTQQQQQQQQGTTGWNNNAKILFLGNTTLSWSAQSSLSVLVPWSNVSLGAGVLIRSGVDLPCSSVGLALYTGPSTAKLHFQLSSNLDRKFRVAYTTTAPHTTLRPTAAGEVRPSQRLLQRPHTLHSTLHKTSTRLPPALGLSGHVTVDGDDAAPHVLPARPWMLLLPPQDLRAPGLRYRQTSVCLDLSANATNSMSFSLSYDEAAGEQPSYASGEDRDLAEFELNDSPQRRGRKLLMLTGSGGSLVTALANFSSGSHDILYEVLLASTPPNRSALVQEERRYHLSFFRSGVPEDLPRPPKVCVQLEFTAPQLPPLDRLDKLLQDPLQATLSGVLIVGNSCRVSKQTEVGSLKIQLAISPKELHQLARHLPGLCHFDRLDPTASLRRTAFYDSLQLDLSWKQDIPNTLLNESYALASVLRSLTLPYIASNCLHVDSPQRRVLVNLTRSHSTRRATGWISRPGCLDYVEEMPFPPVIDFILPLHGHPSQHPQGEVHNSYNPVLPPSDQCYVLPNRIVTFDGVSYDVKPSTCSRVIFNDVSDDASVLITSQGDDDSSQSPQRYRVLLPKPGLDIQVSGQAVQVNGESVSEAFKEISGPSGNTAATITKTSEAVEVLLPGMLYVLVKTSNSLVLRVLDPTLYRGAVRGLCGDFDRDAMGDLKGPRECLFTPSQGELVAAAWTFQPCSSPPHVLEQLKRQQWTCPRTPAELGLPASKDYDPESCRHEVHEVINKPGQMCLTTVPVSACAPHCSPLPGTQRGAMFEVKCWSKEHLPDSLKRAQKEGYLPYLEEAPGVLLPTLLSYPMECIPTREARQL